MYFKVTQYTSWLKEFYEVELTITNNAGEEFPIEDALATIKLPDGLSLADTMRDERGVISMGTIGGGETKSSSWIVRGDKKGKYDIYADFSGKLMPFGEELTAEFKTKEPLEVIGGDALKLEIVHDGYAQGKQSWTSTFTLTNVSDKPIYNVQFDFAGALKATNASVHITNMVLEYPGGIVMVIPWNDGQLNEPNYDRAERHVNMLVYDFDEEKEDIPVLLPGQSVTGTYTVWFDWTPPLS